MAKKRKVSSRGNVKSTRSPKKTAEPKETVSLEGYEELLEEIQAVKMLLMLLLAKLGSESDELAMALGIGASTVRKKLAFRQVDKIPLPAEEE